MKFGRCIESYVVTVYAVNDTGKIYNALRKFGTLEFVRCMGENVVNGVRSNEVRLYQCLRAFRGHLGRPTIAHESHNDVRRRCWQVGAIFVLLAELGLRKPPSGNPERLGLLGEGCTFPLPLWSSNRRESGKTEVVYSAY